MKSNLSLRSPGPWSVFFGIAIGLGILLIGDDQALDIPLHDTYFVIAYTHLLLLLSAAFLVCGAVYLWIPRLGSEGIHRWLGLAHLALLLVTATFICYFLRPSTLQGHASTYYRFNDLPAGFLLTPMTTFCLAGLALLTNILLLPFTHSRSVA